MAALPMNCALLSTVALALLAARGSESFAPVSFARSSVARATSKTMRLETTILFTGFASDAYLSSLSTTIGETSTTGGSATEAYLNSLSQIELSASESMKSLVEFLDNVGDPSFDHAIENAVGSNSFLLALDISTGSSSRAETESGELSWSDAVDAISGNAAVGGRATESLSSELSELSQLDYKSLLDNTGKTTATGNNPMQIPRVGAKFGDQVSDIASGASASLGAVAAGLSDRWNDGADRMGKAFGQAGTSLQAAPRALQAGTTKLVEDGRASLQGASDSLDAGRSKLAEGSANTFKAIGDLSISGVADSVVAALRTVGGVLLQILDAFLETVAGTTVSELVARAQASVDRVVEGAIATVNGVGEITLKQAAHFLVLVLTTVVKILFAILNAVVKVFSGKGITDWATGASEAIGGEVGKLTAQASATATDITHTTLAELGSMVGHFSHDVGKLMLDSVGVAGEAVSKSQVTDGAIPLASGSVESASTVLQITNM